MGTLNVRSVQSMAKKRKVEDVLQEHFHSTDSIGLVETRLEEEWEIKQAKSFQTSFKSRGGAMICSRLHLCRGVHHYNHSIVWTTIKVKSTLVHVIEAYLRPVSREAIKMI